MDAKELRIGNWVNHPDYGEWQWEFSRSDYDAYQMDAFSPIPLTEEWLVRFGFEKVISVTFKIDLTGVRTLELIIVLQHVRNIVALHDNYGKEQKEIIFTRTPIQYIHQLQNLFFALKGEELTFKS